MSLIAWIWANYCYISNQQGFTQRLSAEIFFRLQVTQNIFFVSKSHLLEYVCLLTLVKREWSLLLSFDWKLIYGSLY